MDFSWMAWTWQTALFFGIVGSLLLVMTALAILFPETERVGVLRIPTTRGDRLFISLLGAAFINLAWLGLMGPESRVGPRAFACLCGCRCSATCKRDQSPFGSHEPKGKDRQKVGWT